MPTIGGEKEAPSQKVITEELSAMHLIIQKKSSKVSLNYSLGNLTSIRLLTEYTNLRLS